LKATTPFTPTPLKPTWPASKATPAPSAFGPAKNPANDPPGEPGQYDLLQVTLENPEPKRPDTELMPEVPFIW